MRKLPGLVYSEGYLAEIGLHVFPMRKFRLLRDEIVRRGLASQADFTEPVPATRAQVARVHDDAYIEKLLLGTFTSLDEAILELPYSRNLVDASFSAREEAFSRPGWPSSAGRPSTSRAASITRSRITAKGSAS